MAQPPSTGRGFVAVADRVTMAVEVGGGVPLVGVTVADPCGVDVAVAAPGVLVRVTVLVGAFVVGVGVIVADS